MKRTLLFGLFMMIIPALLFAGHSQTGKPRVETRAVQKTAKPGVVRGISRLSGRNFELLKRISKQQQLVEGMRKHLRQPVAGKNKVQQAAKPRLRRARILGKETAFRAAPSWSTTRPKGRLAAHTDVANVLIGGRHSDTLDVGQDANLTFSFAPGFLSAVLSIYYDADNSGVLKDGDPLISSDILLMDNDEHDADPATGVYSIPLRTIGSVVTDLVGSYIFSVNDFQSVSDAQMVIRQDTALAVIHIETNIPIQRLFFEVAASQSLIEGLFTDSTGKVDAYVDRSVNPDVTIYIVDPFGSANGYIPTTYYQSVAIDSDTTTLVFNFTKATTFVQGFCRDDGGKPVSGAMVDISGGWYSSQTVTDSAGAYRFGISAEFWYYLSAEPPSAEYMRPYISFNVFADSNTTTYHDFVFQRASAAIAGAVQFSGTGVGGIPVRAEKDTLDNEVLTRGDGTYSLPVVKPQSGHYTYLVYPSISNNTYYISSPSPLMAQDGDQNVNFTLLRVNGGIEGTVRDSLSRKPLPGVSLNFSGPTYAWVTTDDSGAYRAPLMDGVYSVYSYATGYQSVSLSGISVNGAFVKLDINLHPYGSIAGTIRDQNGAPIRYAWVNAHDTAYQYYGYANADTLGRYVMTDLPANSYIVSANAPQYIMEYYQNTMDPLKATPVIVTEGVETSGIDFALPLGGSIAGTVLDRTGLAVPNAYVTVYDTAGWLKYSGDVDTSGRYVAGGLATGDYLVTVSAYGFTTVWYDNAQSFVTATRVHVELGQTTSGINFTLSRGSSFSGVVRDNQKKPVPYQEVYAADSLSQPNWWYASTNDSGWYQMTGLPAGVYKASVQSGSYLAQWYDHKSTAEAADPIRLAVEESRSGIDFDLVKSGIYGVVVDDSSGAGIAGVQIRATADNINWFSSITDESGAYSLNYLPAGIYAVRISCDNGTYACRYYYTSHGPALQQKNAGRVVVSANGVGACCNFRLEGQKKNFVSTAANIGIALSNVGILGTDGDTTKPSFRWPNLRSKDYLFEADPWVGGTYISVPWEYGDMYGMTGNGWHTALNFVEDSVGYQEVTSHFYSTDYSDPALALGILVRQQLEARPAADFILCSHTMFYDAISPPWVQEFSDIYAGLAADFDVSLNGQTDLVGIDTTNRLVYMYDGTGKDDTYVGVCVRGDAPVQLKWWVADSDTSYRSMQAKQALLKSDMGSAVPAKNGDYRVMASTGPFPMKHGDSITVTFALVAGKGKAGVLAAARSARGTTEVRNAALDEIPGSFALQQNYPNPFNPATNIVFDLPRRSHAVLKVFNIVGQEVGTLLDEVRPAGHYTVRWSGSSLASGVYFYSLRTESFVQTRKMLLMK